MHRTDRFHRRFRASAERLPLPSRLWAALLVAFCLLAGCGDDSAETVEGEAAGVTVVAEDSSPVDLPAAGEPDPTVIVFLGDSLTAGFGLDAEQAFPHLVGETLRDEGHHLKVVNAGVSGDTTAGGLARLDWLLRQDPDVLVVGLGGNDGLRGLDLAASEENLRQIVLRAQAAGVRVLLLGMLIPPNYGPDYTDAFAAMYPRLAAEQEVELVPFLLYGVAGDPRLNLPDGIHPNPEGQAVVADTVVGSLRRMIEPADS